MAGPQFFINYLEEFSYIGIFILFALAGYLIPIPEEILLLLIGYIAGFGIFNIYIASGVALLSIFAGDNIIFWISKYKGIKIINLLRNKLSMKNVTRYSKLMKNHIGKTTFILRFTPGLRFLGPFLAGSMKVKWRNFLLYNLTAILIYVPLIIFLGYHFNNQLSNIIKGLAIARHFIFIFLLVVVGILISYIAKKK